ncbi:MAG: DNA-deoxyinosine glycosylase [Lachnospiraceae bacterium]
MKKGLPPVADTQANLLILGSLPGDISIERQQYYAHPRNHFWPILASLLAVPLPVSYEERTAMLLAHHVALWDVLHAARRENSLDTNIRDRQPNDLPGFLQEHPDIRFIILNGSEAHKSYLRYFKELAIPYAAVRSSSPVPSKSCNTLEEKIGQWRSVWDTIERTIT